MLRSVAGRIRLAPAPHRSRESRARLERLRPRGLSFKRSLALREFALGIEALEGRVRMQLLLRARRQPDQVAVLRGALLRAQAGDDDLPAAVHAPDDGVQVR
jgi:hypothetical protein